ncbi:MAG: transcription antitermination factor NusB [Clostridia bacterium]|nr:transcription antitermination factor NusB [Clostridia bacterium]
MHNRRQSREIVFGLVYELDFNREYDIEELYANALEEREIEENDFIRSLFFGVAEKLEEIDSLIGEKSEGWNLDRISRVSRAAMRLCIYEMKWADTPMNIAINEAVEIVKKYDEIKAKGFVNGILNAIAKDSEK